MSRSAAAGGLQGADQFSQSLIKLLLASRQSERQDKQNELETMFRMQQLELQREQGDRQFELQSRQIDLQESLLVRERETKKEAIDIAREDVAGEVTRGDIPLFKGVGKLPEISDIREIGQEGQKDLPKALKDFESKTRDISAARVHFNSPEFERDIRAFLGTGGPPATPETIEQIRQKAILDINQRQQFLNDTRDSIIQPAIAEIQKARQASQFEEKTILRPGGSVLGSFGLGEAPFRSTEFPFATQRSR